MSEGILLFKWLLNMSEARKLSTAKISSRSEVQLIRKDLKGTLGFTSGVFDLLHPGHVDYLEKAGGLCDRLAVAINSDSSVQSNKGPKRPICTAEARARVVAGLSFVDYVFIFDESNNNINIETLQPDFYIKAGDYTKASLSSAPLVESYGGQVHIIPTLAGYSSSDIIDKVITLNSQAECVAESRASNPAPCIFVDRDGTINEHVEYLDEASKFKVIPGALEGLMKLREAGYRIVVTTNQPGIGLGYFTKEDLYRVNREFFKACGKVGLLIDKFYYCPHSLVDNCNCAKPNTGMIEKAKMELGVVTEKSFVIGDTTIDIEFGKNSGCTTILVETGLGGTDKRFDVQPDRTVPNLAAAAEFILSNK